MIRRVLVVDDAAVRTRLLDVLRRHAYEACGAVDADAAFALLKEFAPDVILIGKGAGSVAHRFRALPSLADTWLIGVGDVDGGACDLCWSSSSDVPEQLRQLPLLREPSAAFPRR